MNILCVPCAVGVYYLTENYNIWCFIVFFINESVCLFEQIHADSVTTHLVSVQWKKSRLASLMCVCMCVCVCVLISVYSVAP